jgi:hypothetical protein
MTNNPTRLGRLGLTRARLVLLALLILGLAAGAAAYAMRRPTPLASAEWRPPPSAAGRPSAATDPVTPSAVPEVLPSASIPPPTSAGTSVPRLQGPHPPDSAVDPDSVFVDPAATVTRAPQRAVSTPLTCGQWRSRSDEQRTSAASALLRTAWENEGSDTIPPATTARSFGSALTAACLGKGTADDQLPDVAHVVYLADPGKWEP